MRRSLVGSFACIVMAACSARETAETTCNAANWQDLVGQPEGAVHSVLGNVRIIPAGAAVDAEYNPNRLNAEMDPEGRVKRFACY